MEYKKLGKTNLEISRIGFGCWAIGGHGWGTVQDKDSISAIRKALRLGINFFDTADIYGLGHSEEILSKALGKKIKEVIIATKFGLNWRKNNNNNIEIFKDCSPKWVIKALDASLKRLKIDCIPVYQIHWPDPKTPIIETMKVLKKCKEAGKIRYIGCSNFSIDLIKEAQRVCRIDSLQSSYSLIDHLTEEKFAYCKKENMGFISYGSLVQGLLTGKYGLKSKFSNNDHRSQEKYKNFHGARFNANLVIVEKVRWLAKKYNKTCAQVALRWVLDNPSVTCALTGIKKPEQIKNNIGSLNWELHAEDRQMLTDCVIMIYKKYKINS